MQTLSQNSGGGGAPTSPASALEPRPERQCGLHFFFQYTIQYTTAIGQRLNVELFRFDIYYRLPCLVSYRPVVENHRSFDKVPGNRE